MTAAVAGLAALIATSGCEEKSASPDAVRGVEPDRVVLGTYGPLTGPAASWGVSLLAMKAYFAHINAAGGIHGRRIELVLRDDQYSPAKTPTAVRDLVERVGVFAIIGGVGTANGRSVVDYLRERGVPFITPASGARLFSEPPIGNVYTVYLPYALEGRLIGKFLGERFPNARVGVLHQDDDFGSSGAEGLQAELKAQGRSLVVRVTCLPTDTDLTGQVSRLTAAEVDVLVLYTAPRQGALAAKQLAARGRRPQLVTSFVLADRVMFDLAGPELWEGAIAATPYRLADADVPTVEKYRRVMAEHAPGLPVGAFTLAAFAWAQPMAGAIEMAGRDLTPERLYSAFENMRGWDDGGPHWPKGNLTAPITFGPGDHLGNEQVFFAQATNGRWTKLTSWSSIADAPTSSTAPAQEER